MIDTAWLVYYKVNVYAPTSPGKENIYFRTNPST